jgi:hypothetical protein
VVDAVLWLHPATPAATLPPQRASRAGLPITIGGLIPTATGPERAIFGAPVMLRGATLLSHVSLWGWNPRRSERPNV